MALQRSAAPALALARLLTIEPQSAESLAHRLGISVNAVGYRLRTLQELGVPAARERRRGMRLLAPLDWLDAARLQRELASAAPALAVEVLEECPSTSSLLAERAATTPSGAVMTCEYQSAGRGRRGRHWTSGIASALTFSLLWRFAAGPAALSALPLAVAVALAQALEQHGYTGIALKWPNDLLHRGRKFGGILTELSEHAQHPGEVRSTAIIGVGINLRLPEPLADRIDRPATDLSSAVAGQKAAPDRTSLLAALLASLAAALERYEAQGFGAFREGWLRRHAHQGRHVSLRMDDRLIAEGQAAGVDEDGALLLRTEGGLRRILSGEVSLR